MKLKLKVELVGKKSLKMTITHICDEAIGQDFDNRFFKDHDNNFIIWSAADFIFDERQIRFPQHNRLSNLSHFHQFNSEEERYSSLKKMYHSLNNWALDIKIFPNTYQSIEQRVFIHNQDWHII